jgi:hypothetical protein
MRRDRHLGYPLPVKYMKSVLVIAIIALVGLQFELVGLQFDLSIETTDSGE